MGKKGLFLLSSLGFFCVSAFAGPSATRTLRVGIAQDFVTLDWTRSINEVDSPILTNLQHGLVALDARGRPVPDLAEKWTVSPDNKTYRFKLKTDIHWSDGTLLTSKHVVDGLKRLLAPLTAASESYLLFDVKNARAFNRGELEWDKVGVRAIDSRTVEIVLSTPVREWERTLAVRATFPVRDDLIRAQGSSWQKPGNLVNLGPFVLESHEFGSTVVLKRNSRWPHQGNVDRIEFKILSAGDAASAFKKKEIDLLTKVSSELRSSYRSSSELKWLPPVLTKRISFNLQQYPTSDPSVREMIASAIDRQQLAASLGPGHRAGGTLVPPGMVGFLASAGHSYDLARARKLFVSNSAALSSAHLSLLVPAFDENTHDNVATGKFIQNALQKNLGLTIALETVDDSSKWPILSRSGQFSMILHDWKAEVPATLYYYAIYQSGTSTTAPWSNSDYDALLRKAHSAPSLAKEARYYQEADALLTRKNTVMIPLYYAAEPVLVSGRVHGFHQDVYNSYDYSEISLP